MIFLENALSFLDVELVLGVLEPRQREEPVEVVAHDGGLGRHRRHHLEFLDLALALLASLGGHLFLPKFFFQLLNLVLEFVLLAELLLDRAHLLVEVVLLGRFLHLLLDARADALLDLENFQLRAHVAENLLEPLGRVGRFEQRLLVFELDAEMSDQLVGQERGIVDRRDRGHHLGWNLLVEPRVVVEGRDDRAHQRLDFGAAVADLFDFLGLDLEIFLVGDVAEHTRALLALDQRLDGAVGQAQQLHDDAERADRVQVAGRGLGHLRVLLRHQQDRRLLRLGGFQSLNRLLAADEDWIDFVWEYNQFAQREQWNHVRRCIAVIFFIVTKKHLLLESPRAMRFRRSFDRPAAAAPSE